MTDRLDVALRYRPANRDIRGKIIAGTERHSVDFVVNGLSLFAATGADAMDMCGCFSPDYATCGNELARQENERIGKIFTFEAPPDIEQDRLALFVCSHCGDLACGAITFRLSRAGDTVRWSNFAYENGWCEDQTDFETYSAIGPFEFGLDEYLAVIRRAASAQPMIL